MGHLSHPGNNPSEKTLLAAVDLAPEKGSRQLFLAWRSQQNQSGLF
jgi:hypothetical protein